MPNTYNVGAINSQLQDLNRSLFNSGAAMEAGARNQAQADLIAKRGINEDLEAQKRRMEIGREAEMEAAVPGMVNAFVNMFSPMIPKRAVDAGVSVPLPPRRDEAMAAAPVMEAALGADGHSWAPGMNPTELLPAVRMDPAIAPDDLRSTVGGLVRMGVNKGDPNNLQNSIMNTIAALLGGVGEEADAFRAAAIRGNSTPVNQRFTLAGAEQAQEAQRGHELSKKSFDADVKMGAAQAATERALQVEAIRSGDRRDLGKIRSDDYRYGVDVRSGDSRYRTDTNSGDDRYRTDTQARTSENNNIRTNDTRSNIAANRQGTTPGSGKTPGLAQSPEETAKFASLLKQRIAERNNGKADIDPKAVRSVEMAYERIKSENPRMSQSAAIELALDEHDFSFEEGFFSDGPVKGQLKGGGSAKPPAPGAQPAPSAPAPKAAPAAQPKTDEGTIRARYEKHKARIMQEDATEEAKKAAIAKLDEILAQQLNGLK